MTREENMMALERFCFLCHACENCNICPVKTMCKKCKGSFSVLTDNEVAAAVKMIELHQKLEKDKFEEKKETDNVNHPTHYTAGGIECIDALKAATVNLTGIEAVCTANAIKYLWRWKNKNGAEDLKKAKWYIDRLIEECLMSNGREK